MDAIDQMLLELHQLRARLVAEIRASDDAADARADELLARHRDAAAITADLTAEAVSGE
jgi:hypothetical protein